jgi:hypothetical protein
MQSLISIPGCGLGVSLVNLLQTSEHPPVHLHMENFEKATDDFRIVVVKVAKKTS